jgi:DNA-binding HxlR family transcriptional regulator
MIKKPLTDPPVCTNAILALQDALEVFSGKWSLFILHYLSSRQEEVITFKKMEKDIGGISAKVLSKVLKNLETNGLVDRTVMDTRPVTVQYALSTYGLTAKPVLDAMVRWGENHRLQMMA